MNNIGGYIFPNLSPQDVGCPGWIYLGYGWLTRMRDYKIGALTTTFFGHDQTSPYYIYRLKYKHTHKYNTLTQEHFLNNIILAN